MNIKDLIEAYKTDRDSPYHDLRFYTRKHYDALCKRIEADIGTKDVAEIKAREIKHWHQEFLNAGIVSMGHSVMGQMRIICGFGSTILDDDDCRKLSQMLGDMRFRMARPRIERLTFEQAIALRGQAHGMGLRSIAFMQSFQWDLALRQKDGLGEWVPVGEPGVSDTLWHGQKWLRGARWEEIDENLIFTHITSKRQKEIVRNLNLAPMVIQEMMLAFGSVARSKMPASGPIIVCETSGRPWFPAEFRRLWRLCATKAGIQRTVRNMDTRAGAITEALDAGVPLDKVRKMATHSDASTTSRYSRGESEAADDVMKERVASRGI